MNGRILKNTAIKRVILFDDKQNNNNERRRRKKNSKETRRYENAVFVQWMRKTAFT